MFFPTRSSVSVKTACRLGLEVLVSEIGDKDILIGKKSKNKGLGNEGYREMISIFGVSIRVLLL